MVCYFVTWTTEIVTEVLFCEILLIMLMLIVARDIFCFVVEKPVFLLKNGIKNKYITEQLCSRVRWLY